MIPFRSVFFTIYFGGLVLELVCGYIKLMVRQTCMYTCSEHYPHTVKKD